MYPKKTLSAASLLSECERKRRRSLEARGCAKSESEFSMGTAATCPFQCLNRVHEVSNYISKYMHKVTIKHYDKLKFTLCIKVQYVTFFTLQSVCSNTSIQKIHAYSLNIEGKTREWGLVQRFLRFFAFRRNNVTKFQNLRRGYWQNAQKVA